jgi:hypothetical protein
MNLRTMAWKMAAVMSAAVTLQAHPGHAPFSEGTKHFVTSPYHMGAALLFSGIVFAAAQLLKRPAERNFVRALAAVITLLAVLS